jgi:uncharacterized protein (TIGR03435 family)
MRFVTTRRHVPLTPALGTLSVLALLSAAVFGQSADPPKSTFDVADVHVRPHSSNATPNMTGGVLRGGRYDLRNATMLNLIAIAYDMGGDTVVGGPNWLDRDRYDIIAKAPTSTSQATVKVMLQALLADRFKLALHKDTKPLPGFALTVGSGKPKMKEASGGTGTCESLPNQGSGPTLLAGVGCHSITMEAFAHELRNMAGGYTNGAPIVDSTGLTGTWDFELRWSPRVLLAQAGGDGVSFFNAVDQQLGLKLTPQQVPTAVLVVDSVNQKPTDNPSGVAQNIPAPPPAEFDVADIKLSPSDATPNGRLQPGGRIDFQGITMKQMIQLAWDINDDELMAGGPKWLDSTKYSMVARSTTAVTGSGNNMAIDIDDLRLMLQALLKQRFKLMTHMEDRPVSAYALLADKPKLQRADPANRTRFLNGPAPGAKDPRDTSPILNRFVTCQNMTMAQFAEDLPRIAGGYIKEPVVDATGLEGAWDFTLSFSGINVIQGRAGRGGDAGGAASAAPSAADPTGGLSLFDAVSKQLGLKLELRKRPMPVLVIDSVQEKPSDN